MKKADRFSAAETAKRIFGLDARIRWIGISNERGEVLFSEMRPGVQSITPAEADREFVEFGALVVLSIFEKFAPHAGKISRCVVRFEKLAFIVRRLREGIMALSTEPSVNATEVAEIDNRLAQIFPE